MVGVDFHAADELNEHRAAARTWVDANADPAWVEEQHRSGCYQTKELHQRLADDGILAADGPRSSAAATSIPASPAACLRR